MRALSCQSCVTRRILQDGLRHIAVSNAPQRVCKNHAASDKQQQLIEKARQGIQDFGLLCLPQFFLFRFQFD